MKIKLPLITIATCATKSARGDKERVFGEWISVDIQSPEAEDTPVAVRVYDKNGEVESETRWFDGSHWYETEMTAINLKQIGNPNLAFKLPGKIVADQNWQKNYEKLEAGKLKPFVPEEMKSISDNRGPEARADLLKRAADLAVIEGKLWQRGGDPVFCIESAYARPTVESSEMIQSQYWRPTRFFRVDTDRDHILEFSSFDPGRVERMGEALPDVDCLIPESLTLDVESVEFKRLTEQGMNSCLTTIRNHLGEKSAYQTNWRNLSVEKMSLITEICAELKALESGEPDASLENIAEFVTELAPLYRDNQLGHYEALEQLARRYQERPILVSGEEFKNSSAMRM